MSDLKPQSRFRLAPKENHSPTFPVAGAIANHLFLSPSEGGISLEVRYEEAIAFEDRLALGELSQAGLTTTGYDDPDLVQMAEEAVRVHVFLLQAVVSHLSQVALLKVCFSLA